MEAFDIDGNHYLAIVRALEPQHKCMRTEVMIFDQDLGEYVAYQKLSAAVESRFVAFESNKEMFLFLENAEKGCMPKGMFKTKSNISIALLDLQAAVILYQIATGALYTTSSA